MKFNERLRCLRTQASLTQEQLSKLLGVSVMTIRNWESGAKQPSMQAIIALSDVLNISSDTLLGLRRDNEWSPIPVSKAEATLLSNYRLLDKPGKQLVNAVCSMEKARVESEQSKNTPNKFHCVGHIYLPTK